LHEIAQQWGVTPAAVFAKFLDGSPNDLRRTCATWLRAAGTPPHLIAPPDGAQASRFR
jgi:hypothetical protein